MQFQHSIIITHSWKGGVEKTQKIDHVGDTKIGLKPIDLTSVFCFGLFGYS